MFYGLLNKYFTDFVYVYCVVKILVYTEIIPQFCTRKKHQLLKIMLNYSEISAIIIFYYLQL